MKRRILAIMLVLCMVMTLLPAAVFADDSSLTQADLKMATDKAHGYYAQAYELMNAMGYIAAAVDGLNVAKDAIDLAAGYVAKVVEPELQDAKAEALEELNNSKETITAIIGLLEDGEVENVSELTAAVLGLEDELHKHMKTLSALGFELGSDVLDPAIEAMNSAVEEVGALVDAFILEAYNNTVAGVEGFVEDYAAWTEDMGAFCDRLDPVLGDAVRKFLTETPAETMAILVAYGDAAVVKLFADAAAASGDIAAVAVNLAYVMTEYGLEVYNAALTDEEVWNFIDELKNQHAIANDLVKEIANLSDDLTDVIAMKEEALAVAYNNIMKLNAKLEPVHDSVMAKVDPVARVAVDEALDAMCEILCITCEAADGYLGWLAEHSEAMGSALLVAFLENLDELLTTACPIVDAHIWAMLAKIDQAILDFLPIADQWMYDWLYNNPDKVIAFFTEYGDIIACLVDEFGDEAAMIAAYIFYTYGPDALAYAIENPQEAIAKWVEWYQTYGYRVWPMIDVYLEALGVYDNLDALAAMVAQYGEEIVDMLLAKIEELKELATEAVEDELNAAIAAIEEMIAVINGEVEKTIEEVAAAVEAAIDAFYAALEAGLTGEYVTMTDESYVVAIGDSTVADETGSYAAKLVEELGVEEAYLLGGATVRVEDLRYILDESYAGDEHAASIENIEEVRQDYVEKIQMAEMVTVSLGTDNFTSFITEQLDCLMNGYEPWEMNWEAYVTVDGVPYVQAAIDEATARIEAALPADISATLAAVGLKVTAGELAALIVESYVYTTLGYTFNYAQTINLIHEINPAAEVVLVGAYNPMDALVIEEVPVGQIVGDLIKVMDLYSLVYAMITPNTTFVAVPETETQIETGSATLMSYIIGLVMEPSVFTPSDAGHEYIKDEILDSMDIVMVPFEDLDESDWYFEVAAYNYHHALMVGNGANEFMGTKSITRAEVYQMMYNLEGRPAYEATESFVDVEEDAWYYDAMTWAKATGLSKGTNAEGTKGSPNALITREEIVTIFHRYGADMGFDVSAAASLAEFPDAADVASWATDAFAWAVAEEIVVGAPIHNVNHLVPQRNAQRSELAKIMAYFCEIYGMELEHVNCY